MIKFKERTIWVRTVSGELYEMMNETDVFFILISNNIIFHRDKTSFGYLYEYVGEL